MEKIIVTGGAGFIGSHIVDALVAEGYQVHVIDDLSAGSKENINKNAVLHVVDIRDNEKLSEIFKDAKYVFHQAAFPQVQYSIEHPIETNEINLVGTLNVLEACRKNNVKRLVFASSSAIYGNQDSLPVKEDLPANPISPYGAHKYMGEIYMKLYSQIYDLETVSLRYFNVYGPRQSSMGAYASVISKFIDFKKNGEKLKITGDGEQTRDFVNVADVVRANISAMKSDKVGHGEEINIGSDSQYSVNYVAELIGGEVSYLPPRIEPRNTRASIEKALDLLDWKPGVEFSTGIADLKKYNNI